MNKKILWTVFYIIIWFVVGGIALLTLPTVMKVVSLGVMWLWAVISIIRKWKEKS